MSITNWSRNLSSFQLHLRDHGKPVDVSKVGAKPTLLSGTEKQEVNWIAGAFLEAKGEFQGGECKSRGSGVATGQSCANCPLCVEISVCDGCQHSRKNGISWNFTGCAGHVTRFSSDNIKPVGGMFRHGGGSPLTS